MMMIFDTSCVCFFGAKVQKFKKYLNFFIVHNKKKKRRRGKNMEAIRAEGQRLLKAVDVNFQAFFRIIHSLSLYIYIYISFVLLYTYVN
jgi:hypothetical protein